MRFSKCFVIYFLLQFVHHSFSFMSCKFKIGCLKESEYLYLLKIASSRENSNQDNVYNSRNLIPRTLLSVASLAAMQIFHGDALAVSQYDEKLAQRLLRQLEEGEPRIVNQDTDFSENVEDVTSQALSNIEASKSMLVPDQIDNAVHLDLPTFPMKIELPASVGDVTILRNIIQDVATDWKTWLCFVALILGTDRLQQSRGINNLNQAQREQIESLMSRIATLEKEGWDKSENIKSLENITLTSAKELDLLSKQLSVKTSELEDMRQTLLSLSDLDNQIFSDSKAKIAALQNELLDAAINADVQKANFQKALEKSAAELAAAERNIAALQEREAKIIEALKSFLVQQQYLGQGVANMLVAKTVPAVLEQVRMTIPAREALQRVADLNVNNSLLTYKLASAEAGIRDLNEQLAASAQRLEAATASSLEAMTRATDDKSRIGVLEAEVSRLRKEAAAQQKEREEREGAYEKAIVVAGEASARASQVELGLKNLEKAIEQALAVLGVQPDASISPADRLEGAVREVSEQRHQTTLAVDTVRKQKEETAVLTAELESARAELYVARTASEQLSSLQGIVVDLRAELEDTRSKLEAALADKKLKESIVSPLQHSAFSVPVPGPSQVKNGELRATAGEVSIQQQQYTVGETKKHSQEQQLQYSLQSKEILKSTPLVSEVTNVKTELELAKLVSDNLALRTSVLENESRLRDAESKLSGLERYLSTLSVNERDRRINELWTENMELKQKAQQLEEDFWEIRSRADTKSLLVGKPPYDNSLDPGTIVLSYSSGI